MNTINDASKFHQDQLVAEPTREESERQWQEERRKRLLDPVHMAQCEEGIEHSLKDLEEGILFHLADLLALGVYTRHDADSVIKRGIRLLKPFAPHFRQAKTIMDRLGQVSARLEYIPADHINEDSHDIAPDVLVGRLRERQQFLKSSVLSDLKSQRKWIAEAKLAQRRAARSVKVEGNPATAA